MFPKYFRFCVSESNETSAKPVGHGRDYQPCLEQNPERAERDRMERVYKAYSSDPYYKKIWSGDVARLIRDRIWDDLSRALHAERLDITRARLLDLGAGGGEDCDGFRQLGFRPEGIVALDLLHEYVSRAKSSHAWLVALQADGAVLPFRDSSFDVVYQSTMLSSVLDRDRRAQILREVRRVLALGGLFVSYDMRYPNPWNRHTRVVLASELRAAFPGCRIRAHTITPIPQLVRFLGRFAKPMWRIIEGVPPLRSHILAVVRKA